MRATLRGRWRLVIPLAAIMQGRTAGPDRRSPIPIEVSRARAGYILGFVAPATLGNWLARDIDVRLLSPLSAGDSDADRRSKGISARGMKRLTDRRRKWFANRAYHAALKRARRQRPLSLVSAISPAGAWIGQQSQRLPDMPAILCFDQNASETVAVLSDFARRARVPVRGVRLYKKISKHRGGKSTTIPKFRSFETIQVITPAVALVLAAEYERIWRFGGAMPFVANIDRWRPSVVEALSEIGFFEIVGFTSTTPGPSEPGDEKIVRMKSGKTADSAAVRDLMDNLRSLYPGPADETHAGLVHLYGAMIEAIVNVVRHAYPDNGRHWGRPSGRWWMTGAVNRLVRRTTAVVYDQGVTIPVTLPNWRRYGNMSDRFMQALGVAHDVSDTRLDGRVIQVAVEEAVSSTEDDHRGNGLAQMRNFVNQCRDGHLRIVSRCGEVVFRPGLQPDVRTYDVPIRGTLIEWRVLL